MKNWSSAVRTVESEEAAERSPIRRQHKVLVQVKNEERQRRHRHGEVGHPAGQEQAEPIPEVINRLEQELADVAVLDVGGNLPIVLVHRRQGVHHGREQVIRDHLRQRIGADRRSRALARVDFLPHVEHGDERDQAEHRPRQEVEPVGQVVLNPDINDMPVFLHRAAVWFIAYRSSRRVEKRPNKAGLFRPAG